MVYASAARRGAPGAVQVADRWHIVYNLADALERILLRRRCELDDAERVLLTELCRKSSELATSRRLAQRFMVLVRERRGTQLEQWIADVQTTGPPELRGFSRNLHRDWLAVRAGFTVHWSSGPVEGNINRVKLIKREMYGPYVL